MAKIIVNNSVESMKAFLNVIEENMKLKRQVKEQQEIIENIELQEISKEVAEELIEWLNNPIPNHLTEEQDAKLFSLRMTKFIKQKLRN